MTEKMRIMFEGIHYNFWIDNNAAPPNAFFQRKTTGAFSSSVSGEKLTKLVAMLGSVSCVKLDALAQKHTYPGYRRPGPHEHRGARLEAGSYGLKE